MKICIINSLFYPDQRGGVEEQVQNIAKTLAKEHEVTVICTNTRRNNRGIPFITEKIGQITVYRLNAYNLSTFNDLPKHGVFLRLLWHFIDLFNWPQYQRIKNILVSINPDLVWAHNLMGTGILATHSYQKYHYWQTIHDVQLFDPSGTIYSSESNFFYSLIRAIYARLVKTLIAQPEQVISPSQWLADFYLAKKYFTKSTIRVLANPIDLPMTVNHRKNTEATRERQLLFLGQMERHKGIFFLLQELKEIKTEFKFHLTVVGSGSQVKSFKKQIQQESFCSYYPWPPTNDQVYNYLSATDLLIFPSQCLENCPLVLQWALQLSTPILASRIGGVVELLEHDQNLFTVNDSRDFQNKLQAVLQGNDITIKKDFLSTPDYCQLLLAGKS